MVVLNRGDTQGLMASTAAHLPKDNMVLLKGSMVHHHRGNSRVMVLPPLLRILQPELLQVTMLPPRLAVLQLPIPLVPITGLLHREGPTKPLLRPRSTNRLGHQVIVQPVGKAGRVVMVGIRLSRLD